MCSQPADKYPHHFSEEGLFGRHPFALPTVIAAVLSLLGTLMSATASLPLETLQLLFSSCIYTVVWIQPHVM